MSLTEMSNSGTSRYSFLIIFFLLSQISFGQKKNKILSITGLYSSSKIDLRGIKESGEIDFSVNGLISISNKSYLGAQLNIDFDFEKHKITRLGGQSVTQYKSAQLGPVYRYYFLKLGGQNFYLQSSVYVGLAREETSNALAYPYPASIFSYGSNLRPGINFIRKKITFELSYGLYKYEEYKLLSTSFFPKTPNIINDFFNDLRIGVVFKVGNNRNP